MSKLSKTLEAVKKEEALSRQDFESLAKMISNASVSLQGPVFKSFVSALTDWLSIHNPRFDKEKFLQAAGQA